MDSVHANAMFISMATRTRPTRSSPRHALYLCTELRHVEYQSPYTRSLHSISSYHSRSINTKLFSQCRLRPNLIVQHITIHHQSALISDLRQPITQPIIRRVGGDVSQKSKGAQETIRAGKGAKQKRRRQLAFIRRNELEGWRFGPKF